MKGWLRTQNHVTLSSAEAELTGLVAGATHALGMRSIARDLGIDLATNPSKPQATHLKPYVYKDMQEGTRIDTILTNHTGRHHQGLQQAGRACQVSSNSSKIQYENRF